jgi:hypothetical protein
MEAVARLKIRNINKELIKMGGHGGLNILP